MVPDGRMLPFALSRRGGMPQTTPRSEVSSIAWGRAADGREVISGGCSYASGPEPTHRVLRCFQGPDPCIWRARLDSWDTC